MLKVNNISGAGVVSDTTLSYSQIYTQPFSGGTLQATSGRVFVLVTPIVVNGYTSFKVVLRNGASSRLVGIQNVYFGQLTGSYSFASAPTAVTWNQGSSVATFPGFLDSTLTSDAIAYTPSGTGTLCLAYELDSTNTNYWVKDGNGSGYAAYTKTGTGASTQSKSGYTLNGTTRTLSMSAVLAA